MSNKVELVEVCTDDWIVVYENGVNTWEGHSLDLSDVLEGLVGSEIVSYKSYWVDSGVFDEFPMLLEKIDKDLLK